MQKKKTKKDGLFLKLIEFFAYNIAVFYSYFIVLEINLFNKYDLRNYEAFYETVPIIMFFSTLLLISIGLFKTVGKTKTENITLIFIAASIILVLYMAVAFFSRDFAMPRTVLMVGFIWQLIFFTIIKFLVLAFVRYRKGVREILIIGDESEKEHLVSKIYSSNIYKERLKYYIDPSLVKNYKKYIEKSDKIYVSDSIPSEIKDSIITHCISRDKSLYIVPKTFEIAIFNSKLTQVSDMPMFRIESLYLTQEKLLLKRLFDLIIAIPAFILVAPIMAIIYMLILIKEGKPVIFVQERVTVNNKRFNLYKFRSMSKDAEKNSGAIWATENDPRVTKLGRFLRRYWLDELPQLINVIKGDMSLVGPRPERPIFIDEFSTYIPDFHYRLSVKAGVTGLAQVLGKYATTPQLKIKFDILYIKNASILFDLKIIFETVKKIIMGTLKRGLNQDLSYQDVLNKHQLVEKHKCGMTIYRFYKQK